MIEVDFSDIVEDLEVTDDLEIGDDLTVGGDIDITTGHLLLPLTNDSATPTISFGDGNTGLYESLDNILKISIDGINRWFFHTLDFRGNDDDSPKLISNNATATVPVFVISSDENTGIGWAGADSLSLIAGGVEGHRITETAGLIDHVLTGIVKTPTTQTLTGAGAVDIVSAMTLIVTTGADALTLADGAEGQEKFIVMKTDANDGTLTPAHLKNGTTITFDDVGDSAHLIFMDGAWVWMGGTATLA